jgi:hypothetical protein
MNLKDDSYSTYKHDKGTLKREFEWIEEKLLFWVSD